MTAKTPDPDDAESTESPTLSAFDWLDTMVDEMLIASDRLAERASAARSSAAPAFSVSRTAELANIAPRLSDSTILGQVVLGYSPMIDRHRTVIATRLTVAPVHPGASLDAGALLSAVGEVWPAGGGAVSLNVSSETLLTDLLRATPTANLMIEVPAFLAAEAGNVEALLRLKARGNTLLIKGRPLRELPRDVLPCFRWSIIDLADDRRIGRAAPPSDVKRSIPFVQSGVRSLEQLEGCFQRGAVAVLGWPIDEPVTATTHGARPDLQVVIEMINRIDRHEPVEALEHALMRDPALAFELLRHTNSPSVGMRVETSSFRHAIMMLGYHELRRWLASRLATTGDDNHFKPANYAALRRGLLMRELAPNHSDEETRSELFMCGVFSLLDRVFAKPVGELLKTLVVPERVRQALVDQAGPYLPMLELVRAVESEMPHDIRAAAEALFMGPMETNRALLRSLAAAAQVE